jgi:hypothetical protein
VVAGKRRGINNNHFQNDSSTYDWNSTTYLVADEYLQWVTDPG